MNQINETRAIVKEFSRVCGMQYRKAKKYVVEGPRWRTQKRKQQRERAEFRKQEQAYLQELRNQFAEQWKVEESRRLEVHRRNEFRRVEKQRRTGMWLMRWLCQDKMCKVRRMHEEWMKTQPRPKPSPFFLNPLKLNPHLIAQNGPPRQEPYRHCYWIVDDCDARFTCECEYLIGCTRKPCSPSCAGLMAEPGCCGYCWSMWRNMHPLFKTPRRVLSPDELVAQIFSIPDNINMTHHIEFDRVFEGLNQLAGNAAAHLTQVVDSVSWKTIAASGVLCLINVWRNFDRWDTVLYSIGQFALGLGLAKEQLTKLVAIMSDKLMDLLVFFRGIRETVAAKVFPIRHFQNPLFGGSLDGQAGKGYVTVTEASPLEEMLVGVDLTPGMSIVGGLISLILSVAVMRVIPGGEKFDTLFNRYSKLSGVIRSAGDIFKRGGEFFREIIAGFIETVFGIKIEMMNEWKNIDAWIGEVKALMIPDFENQIKNNEQMKQTVESLLQRGMNIIRMLDSLKVPLAERTAVTQCMMFLTRVREVAGNCGAGQTKPRVAPSIFHIFGNSGVGKSTVLWALIAELQAALGVTQPSDLHEKTYFRRPGTEFWDGYSNGVNVVVCDDFGARKDTETNPSEDYLEAIHMSNTAFWQLNMAELSDKRSTFFNAKCVLWTSNRSHFNVVSLTNPEAVIRRVDIKIRQRPHPNFSKPDTQAGQTVEVLDQTKVNEAIRQHGKDAMLGCVLFDIIDKSDANDRVLQKDLTFWDVATMCVEGMLRNINYFSDFNDTLGDHVAGAIERCKDGVWKAGTSNFNPALFGQSGCDHRDYTRDPAYSQLQTQIRRENPGPSGENSTTPSGATPGGFGPAGPRANYTPEPAIMNRVAGEAFWKNLRPITDETHIHSAAERMFFTHKRTGLFNYYFPGTRNNIHWNVNEYNQFEYEEYAETVEEADVVSDAEIDAWYNILYGQGCYVIDAKDAVELERAYMAAQQSFLRVDRRRVQTKEQVEDVFFHLFVGACRYYGVKATIPDDCICEKTDTWHTQQTNFNRFHSLTQLSKYFITQTKNKCDTYSGRIGHWLSKVYKCHPNVTSYLDMAWECFKILMVITPVSYITGWILNYMMRPSKKANKKIQQAKSRKITPEAYAERDARIRSSKNSESEEESEELTRSQVDGILKVFGIPPKQEEFDAETYNTNQTQGRNTVKTEHYPSENIKQKTVVRTETYTPDINKGKQLVHTEVYTTDKSNGRPHVKTESYQTDNQTGKRVVQTEALNIQGVVDQNAHEVVDVCLKNMYKLEWWNGEDWISALNITIVKGRLALANRHLISYFGKSDCWRIRNHCFPEGIEFNINLCNIAHIDAGPFAQRDVMMIELPRLVHQHRDITSKFMTGEDFSRFKSLQQISLIGYVPQDRLAIRQYFSTDIESVDNVVYDLKGAEGKEIMKIRQVFRYKIQTTQGDCGAVLVAFDKNFNNKIFGIHCAGTTGVWTGYGTPVNQMMVKLLMQEMDLKYQESVMSPDVDELLREKQEILTPQIDGDIITWNPTLQIAGNFYPIGVAQEGVFAPSRTRIFPSPLHGQIAAPTMAPARLMSFYKDGILVDPMANARLKASPISKPIDESILRTCAYNFLQKIDTSDADKHLLTYEQAISGKEGDGCYPPMKRRTSPGYGWKGKGPGKTQWLGEDDYIYDDIDLRTKYEQILQKCRNGERPGTVWTDVLKDERRTLAKVEAGKTRLFSCGEMAYTLLFRQYFAGFIAHMTRNKIDFESCVGVNVYSMDWTLIVNKLQEVGNKVIAGDFTNYDGTLHPQILWEILTLINAWYGQTAEHEDNTIRRALWSEIVNSVHIVKNTFYMWNHSQPSGCPMTTILNCTYHSISARYVYILCAQRYSPKFQGIRHFDSFIRHVNYGDDDLYCISDEVIDWFNQETISEAYKEISMVYTDESKSNVLVPYRKLTEVNFLKRTFRWDKDFKRYRAPLALDTIREMAMWVHGTVDTYELTADTLREAVFELAQHDRQTYERELPPFEAGAKLLRTKTPCALERYEDYQIQTLERSLE
jgi:hypothetical protein